MIVLWIVACGGGSHAPADTGTDTGDDAQVCAPGTADCDGDPANGCETSLTTEAHCGACTNACATGAACVYTGCSAAGPMMTCATPIAPGLPAPACASTGVDSDGDGLLDAWETAGYIDVNCNGAFDDDGVDLPLPDAHVDAPDLYVELDYLEQPSASCTPGPCTPCTIDDDCAANPGEQCGDGGTCVHTHRPKQATIDAVVAAFQRGLPATKPGIYLHVDAAHASAIPEAGRQVVSFGTSIVDPSDRALDPACVGPDAADFYDVKDQFFFSGPGGPTSLYARVRRRVYHYALFAHYSSCPPGPTGDANAFCSACPSDRGGNPPQFGATGTSETPGNDVLVSLGAELFDLGLPASVNAEGGTFMHELGHNLGLGHGVALDGATAVPAQNPSRSPNYLSVMNYNYQTLGVPVASAPGVGTASQFRIGYSDVGTCAPLDEDALDETAGAACGASSTYVAYWFPGNFAGTAPGGGNHHASTTTGSPINWDNDASGVLDTSVAVDLNNDTQHQTHRAMNDWAFDANANRLTTLRVDASCYAWTLLDGAPPATLSANEQTAAAIAAHDAAGAPVVVDALVLSRRDGDVAIAILGSRELDVAQIVPAKLRVGGAPVSAISCADVDGDGRLDLIVHARRAGALDGALTSHVQITGAPRGR